MKKLLTVLILTALLLALYGCSGGNFKEDSSDESMVLPKALEILSKANSFEYTVYTGQQSKYEDGNVILSDKSEVKEIVEPLTTWGKADKEMTRRNGDHVRSVFETYRKADKNQFAFYMRMSMEQPYTEQEPPLGEWEENIITDKEQIEMTIEFAKDLREAELYLLSTNMESFQFVEETETGGASALRYDGTIDPSTAIEAYKIYLRDYYAQFYGVVKELKDPFELKKVEIDKTAMMQIYFDQEMPKVNQGEKVPIIQKHIDTYVIKGIDTLKEIKKPE